METVGLGSTLDLAVYLRKSREVFLEERTTHEWVDVSRKPQNTGSSKPEADHVSHCPKQSGDLPGSRQSNSSRVVSVCFEHWLTQL